MGYGEVRIKSSIRMMMFFVYIVPLDRIRSYRYSKPCINSYFLCMSGATSFLHSTIIGPIFVQDLLVILLRSYSTRAKSIKPFFKSTPTPLKNPATDNQTAQFSGFVSLPYLVQKSLKSLYSWF